MRISIPNISVRGISTALPKDKLDISSLGARFGDNEIKRIMMSTGIQSVHVAQKELKLSDLCIAAGQHLLDGCQIPAKEVDGIIVVSQSHDSIMPATSVKLQHLLGLSQDSVAFDISYGCSGYIYGLYQASMMISSGSCERVLLFAGDIITPLLNPEDHQVRTVFGDAVSATLIDKGEDCIDLILKTDGSGMDHLKADKLIENEWGSQNYLYMNGAEIMEFALREVPLVISELLEMKGWSFDDVGTFFLHQANSFMLNYLRKKMRLAKDTVPVAVENTGNTGSASIPLTISLRHEALAKEDCLRKVVLCGFGVGLSWGAAGVNLSNATVLPPIEV